MIVKDGFLIMGKKDCFCGNGTVHRRVDCDVCKGTGKGIRGGRDGCKNCHGGGRVLTDKDPLVCKTCQGDYKDHRSEDVYDYAPVDILLSIPVRVVHKQRTQSWAEQYIGLGLYSCTDYGRYKDMSDEELIAHVRSGNSFRRTQALNIADKDKDNKLCDYVAIVTADNGYSVIGVWD